MSIYACNNAAVFHNNMSQIAEGSSMLRLHSVAPHWEDFDAEQYHLVYSIQAVMNSHRLTESTRAFIKKIFSHRVKPNIKKNPNQKTQQLNSHQYAVKHDHFEVH